MAVSDVSRAGSRPCPKLLSMPSAHVTNVCEPRERDRVPSSLSSLPEPQTLFPQFCTGVCTLEKLKELIYNY